MAVLKHEFTLRLRDEIYDQTVEMAKKQRRSMTNFIEYVLQEYIAQHQPPARKPEKPCVMPNDIWNDYFGKEK